MRFMLMLLNALSRMEKNWISPSATIHLLFLKSRGTAASGARASDRLQARSWVDQERNTEPRACPRHIAYTRVTVAFMTRFTLFPQ
jgi:hypothetical protein